MTEPLFLDSDAEEHLWSLVFASEYTRRRAEPGGGVGSGDVESHLAGMEADDAVREFRKRIRPT